MRILVTGGAGYIGSHTARVLAQSGHVPVVLDNLSEGHSWAVQWGPFVRGDLVDRRVVRRTLQEHGIESVVHFAANAYVGESVENPRKYFQNNVANTLVLLDAMLDAGVRSIVFSSSCTVYGPPEALPLGEDHPQGPISPYGESKLFMERVLRWYERAYGLRWMALRYFNAAGADPDGVIGELHRPETHLIPRVIEAAYSRTSRVKVYGTDYPTPDGTAVRDYVHVADLARAHVAALDYLTSGGESRALNLGTGRGYSVLEVIRAVEHVSGRSVWQVAMPRRTGDPAALVADADAAATALGWRPLLSDINDIVSTAWQWRNTLGADTALIPERRV